MATTAFVATPLFSRILTSASNWDNTGWLDLYRVIDWWLSALILVGIAIVSINLIVAVLHA